MIILDVKQGSLAWQRARLGIPTASEFSKIITPGGKLSASRKDYIGTLLAQWALGEEEDSFQDEWIERGKLLEPEARDYYAFHRDAEVRTIGFAYRDENREVGCSPDGLVGDDGALELKCPKAATHLRWLAIGEVPREHAMQVQGQIWVTGRQWVDFMSYHPGLPPLIVRAAPDAVLQSVFNLQVEEFIGELELGKIRLRGMGVVPAEELERELNGDLDPIEEMIGRVPDDQGEGEKTDGS